MGLYTQFLNEGESFVPKYNALLKATATCSVEDTAKMAGKSTNRAFFSRSMLHIHQSDLQMSEGCFSKNLALSDLFLPFRMALNS